MLIKVNFEKKNSVLLIEKFPFLVLARNTIMYCYNNLLSNFRDSVICQVVGYGRLQVKGNFNPLAAKSGRGRL